MKKADTESHSPEQHVGVCGNTARYYTADVSVHCVYDAALAVILLLSVDCVGRDLIWAAVCFTTYHFQGQYPGDG